MEYWSNGVMGSGTNTPILQLLQHSNLMKFTLNWLKEFVDIRRYRR